MRSSIGNERVERERIRLIAALALGCVTPVAGLVGCASTFGRRPEPLPPDRSVWSAEGGFRVNGASADDDTLIRAGDVVETGDAGPLVFAVGETAFLLRARSRLELEVDRGTRPGPRDRPAGGRSAHRVRTAGIPRPDPAGGAGHPRDRSVRGRGAGSGLHLHLLRQRRAGGPGRSRVAGGDHLRSPTTPRGW
ncbi:MAG: hypothetical protein U5R48_13665 [Gammaproteobacteria bacterium]|nr:hypothetical protein [Gammaproteobacteria bacterium]